MESWTTRILKHREERGGTAGRDLLSVDAEMEKHMTVQPMIVFTMAPTLVGPWSCGHPVRG